MFIKRKIADSPDSPEAQARRALAATVADEARPYTDPEATYGLAGVAHRSHAEGVALRAYRLEHPAA